MKRIVLLIIGVIVVCATMAQVNSNFKSVRIINSDSTHGALPGTIYRGSDLILRWVDESGIVHRFITSNSGDFWKVSGTTTLVGSPTISGGDDLTINPNTNLTLVTGNEIGLVAPILTLATGPGGAINLSATSLSLNLPSGAGGDMYRLNGSNFITRIPIGSSGNVLTVSGGLPVWQAPTGSGVSSAVSPITFAANTISTSMATNRLIGRSTASTGVMEEILVGTGLSLSAGTLSSTVSGLSGLTTGRVPVAASATSLTDDADITFSGSTLTTTNHTITSLTSGRIPFASTGGSIVDDGDFSFDNNPLSNQLSIGNLRLSGSPSGSTSSVMSNPSGQFAINNGSNPLVLTGVPLSLSTGGSGDIGMTVLSGSGQYFTITGLPTSDPSVTASVWNSNGFLVQGAITGPSSGTYTPTLTAVSNVSATTSRQCQYSRTGNSIIVSGVIDIDATAITTTTTVGISLPISSDLTNISNLGGTSVSAPLGATLASVSAGISADITNDRANLTFVSNGSDVTNSTFTFQFLYLVQ